MFGDGDQNVRHVEVVFGHGGERSYQVAQVGGCIGRIDVYVQADADEIDIANSLAEKAGELAIFVKEIVGPFEENLVFGGDLGDGVAEGEAGDQR